jgi:hypothetical protein
MQTADLRRHHPGDAAADHAARGRSGRPPGPGTTGVHRDPAGVVVGCRHHLSPDLLRLRVRRLLTDVYSRQMVGWQLSRSLRTDLALDALELSFCTRHRAGRDVSELDHRSDGRSRTGLNRSSPRGPPSAGPKPARLPRSGPPAPATTMRRSRRSTCSPRLSWPATADPGRASTTRRSPPRNMSTGSTLDAWTARWACCHRPSSRSSITDATPRRPPSPRQFRAFTEADTRQVRTGSPGLPPWSAAPASEPR